MNIWLVTHNFPPEVNAVANRSYEHARQWVKDGANVDVITDVPHFPEGRVYKGYRNRVGQEDVEGIRVTRVPSYIAANQRRIRRILSYVSFMASVVVFSGRVKRKPDVIIGTSPHIFTAIAALVLSRLRRVPFVLEVRDLWPQSIRAVGAIKTGFILGCVQYAVDLLYRAADKIVIVSEAFRGEIESRCVLPQKIVYIPNGFSTDNAAATEGQEEPPDEVKARYGIQGKFVVAYIGTIGMAHGLESIVEAARSCCDPDVVYLVAGAGANWDTLQKTSQGLPNFKLLSKLPRDQALTLLKASDVSLIHLKDSPVFRTVLPSKMFEAMALRKPIILGVQGEAARLLQMSRAGIAIQPESPDEINSAVQTLKSNQSELAQMAECGSLFLQKYHDRVELARSLLEHLKTTAVSESGLIISQPDTESSSREAVNC